MAAQPPNTPEWVPVIHDRSNPDSFVTVDAHVRGCVEAAYEHVFSNSPEDTRPEFDKANGFSATSRNRWLRGEGSEDLRRRDSQRWLYVLRTSSEELLLEHSIVGHGAFLPSRW